MIGSPIGTLCALHNFSDAVWRSEYELGGVCACTEQFYSSSIRLGFSLSKWCSLFMNRIVTCFICAKDIFVEIFMSQMLTLSRRTQLPSSTPSQTIQYRVRANHHRTIQPNSMRATRIAADAKYFLGVFVCVCASRKVFLFELPPIFVSTVDTHSAKNTNNEQNSVPASRIFGWTQELELKFLVFLGLCRKRECAAI